MTAEKYESQSATGHGAGGIGQVALFRSYPGTHAALREYRYAFEYKMRTDEHVPGIPSSSLIARARAIPLRIFANIRVALPR